MTNEIKRCSSSFENCYCTSDCKDNCNSVENSTTTLALSNNNSKPCCCAKSFFVIDNNFKSFNTSSSDSKETIYDIDSDAACSFYSARDYFSLKSSTCSLESSLCESPVKNGEESKKEKDKENGIGAFRTTSDAYEETLKSKCETGFKESVSAFCEIVWIGAQQCGSHVQLSTTTRCAKSEIRKLIDRTSKSNKTMLFNKNCADSSKTRINSNARINDHIPNENVGAIEDQLADDRNIDEVAYFGSEIEFIMNRFRNRTVSEIYPIGYRISNKVRKLRERPHSWPNDRHINQQQRCNESICKVKRLTNDDNCQVSQVIEHLTLCASINDWEQCYSKKSIMDPIQHDDVIRQNKLITKRNIEVTSSGDIKESMLTEDETFDHDDSQEIYADRYNNMNTRLVTDLEISNKLAANEDCMIVNRRDILMKEDDDLQRLHRAHKSKKTMQTIESEHSPTSKEYNFMKTSDNIKWRNEINKKHDKLKLFQVKAMVNRYECNGLNLALPDSSTDQSDNSEARIDNIELIKENDKSYFDKVTRNHEHDILISNRHCSSDHKVNIEAKIFHNVKSYNNHESSLTATAQLQSNLAADIQSTQSNKGSTQYDSPGVVKRMVKVFSNNNNDTGDKVANGKIFNRSSLQPYVDNSLGDYQSKVTRSKSLWSSHKDEPRRVTSSTLRAPSSRRQYKADDSPDNSIIITNVNSAISVCVSERYNNNDLNHHVDSGNIDTQSEKSQDIHHIRSSSNRRKSESPLNNNCTNKVTCNGVSKASEPCIDKNFTVKLFPKHSFSISSKYSGTNSYHSNISNSKQHVLQSVNKNVKVDINRNSNEVDILGRHYSCSTRKQYTNISSVNAVTNVNKCLERRHVSNINEPIRRSANNRAVNVTDTSNSGHDNGGHIGYMVCCDYSNRLAKQQHRSAYVNSESLLKSNRRKRITLYDDFCYNKHKDNSSEPEHYYSPLSVWKNTREKYTSSSVFKNYRNTNYLGSNCCGAGKLRKEDDNNKRYLGKCRSADITVKSRPYLRLIDDNNSYYKSNKSVLLINAADIANELHYNNGLDFKKEKMSFNSHREIYCNNNVKDISNVTTDVSITAKLPTYKHCSNSDKARNLKGPIPLAKSFSSNRDKSSKSFLKLSLQDGRRYRAVTVETIS
ncbi:hypothetical protein GJ496_010703 [Pomphorhynchus laevis]|nr:hypothetical protein GJ496_010703 [Pomphorhynchus laevis]